MVPTDILLHLGVYENKFIYIYMSRQIFLFKETRRLSWFYSFRWVPGLWDVTMNEIL